MKRRTSLIQRAIHVREDIIIDQHVETLWQRWQSLYLVKRTNPRNTMKTITIISSVRDCFIELTHDDSDPGLWIVRRWRKFLWFKKAISSDWFNDGRQALVFANEIKRKRDGH
jgi:hypothetical protein